MGAEMVAKKAGPAEPSDARAAGPLGISARGMELLWGEAGQPSRGPKPGMSLARIVRAAIDLADAEGMAAVSMQRVAAEFGFTTMALYRYVPGKSELIDLMVDTAVGEPPDLSAIEGGWRPKLAEWARLTLAFFHRHPWVLAEVTTRIMGPNQLGFLESAVQAMRETGLTAPEVLGSVLAVNGLVRSSAPFAGDLHRDGVNEWEQAMLELIRQHSDQFPALTEVMAEQAATPPSDDFEFGLQRVLDGIEVYIERRAARR
ncbi:MAG: TetR/AcrR family transcriptional regulator [Labedaea sp.]